jgi:hypothetical protein
MGRTFGYYVSTVDNQAFELKSVSKRQDLLMIDAVAHLDDGKSKSLCLYVPEHEGDDNGISLGHIVGNLRDANRRDRTGAWSAVVLRPNFPPALEDRILCDISVYSDYLRTLADANEDDAYDKQIIHLTDYVHEVGLAGVLFSETLRDFPEAKAELITAGLEKLVSFRKLFDLNERQLTLAESSLQLLIDSLGLNPTLMEVAKLVARQNVPNSGTAPRKVRKRDWEGNKDEVDKLIACLSPKPSDSLIPYCRFKEEMRKKHAE